MRFASIDIGSNTTLLLIVEQTGKSFEVLSDKIYFTRLAENLQKTKVFSPASLERLERAFKSIEETLKKYNVEEMAIVATSASRESQNKKQLFDLAEKYNLSNIEIISPEREAELTFMGSLFALGHEFSNPLVVDIGGGSTELVSAKRRYSLNIGTISLTEKFLTHQALSRADKTSLNNFIEKELEFVKTFLQEKFDTVIFVAGTPISLAFMEYQTSDTNKVHGKIIKEEQVYFWLEKLSNLSFEERKKIEHLPQHRADAIISGLSLLSQILKSTKQKQFLVSATGVRYGLTLKQMEKK